MAMTLARVPNFQKLHRVPHQEYPGWDSGRSFSWGHLGPQAALRFIQIPPQFRLPLVQVGGVAGVLQLLAHGLQFFGGGVGGPAGILNDLLGLPPCLLPGPCPAPFCSWALYASLCS